MLRPGERKIFVFMFSSEKVGMFSENWDLLTDPQLSTPLPQLNLTGYSFELDGFVPHRYYLEEELRKSAVMHCAREVVSDVVRQVRTPTPPPPDLEDPTECQEQFESRNIEYEVWYTPDIINLLKDFEARIKPHIPKKPESFPEWDLTFNALKKLVILVPNERQKRDFEARLFWLLSLAKVKPTERSPWHDLARSIVSEVATDLPGLMNSVRKEYNMEDLEFQELWEMTPVQLEAYKKSLADKEVLRAKPAKGKKPKPEEELAKERQDCKDRIKGAVVSCFASKLSGILDYENYLTVMRQLDTLHQAHILPKILDNTNRLNKAQKNSNLAKNKMAQNSIARLTQDTFDRLVRKIGLNDVDVERKKVILRMNLDVQLSEPIWVEQIQDVTMSDKSGLAPVFKVCEPRLLLNEKPLRDALETVKFLLDHLAKCVIIVGTLGPRSGEPRPEFTLRPVYDFIREEIDNAMYWFDDPIVPEFENVLEDLPENSIVFFENFAFQPAEFGYSFDSMGELVHYDYRKIVEFRQEIASHCDLYVNDCIGPDTLMESSLGPSCAVVNPGTSSILMAEYTPQKVMGLLLEAEVRSLGMFFLETERMFVACLGGTADSKVPLEDRLLIAYCLIDTVDKLLLGGELALLFMPYAVGPKDSRLQVIVDRVVEYAAEKQVEIVLPCDFLIAEPLQPSQESPQDPESPFTWGHYAPEWQVLEAGQLLPEGFTIIGYGPKTVQKWEDVLQRCLRILWSGSLDLHCSDKPELNGVTRSVVDYLYSKRELKDVKCATYDVEPSFNHVVTVSGYLNKELSEPGSPKSSASEFSERSAQDISQMTTEALTASEMIESMVTHKWNGGPLTLALLQGRKVKGLDLLDEHPKPKPKTIEDDTSYLDLI